MPVVSRYSMYANNGNYYVTYYCYGTNCPARTDKEPWPHSNGHLKQIELISKKGNKYKRKRWHCDHCGKEMSGTVNANDFA